MRKAERTHLLSIANILENDDCSCVDPPWLDGDDHPSEHAQYCPHYLAAYLDAILAGKKKPDPDDWPDAPEWCTRCEMPKKRCGCDD